MVKLLVLTEINEVNTMLSERSWLHANILRGRIDLHFNLMLIFFTCDFSALAPTLGDCWADRLTKFMLITEFLINVVCDPKVTGSETQPSTQLDLSR